MNAAEEYERQCSDYLEALRGVDRYGTPDPEVIAVLNQLASYIDDYVNDRQCTVNSHYKLLELVEKLPVTL